MGAQTIQVPSSIFSSQLVLDLLSRNLSEPLARNAAGEPLGLSIALAEVRRINAVLFIASEFDETLDL